MKNSPLSLLALLGLLCVTLGRAAEPAGDSSASLRAALRDTTQQLRSVQADLATAQSAQATLSAEKKALAEQYEALKKQIVADRTAAEKTTGQLSAQNTEQKAVLARLNEQLAQARAEGEKNAQAARTAEAQVAQLTAENIAQERRLADREAKNLKLFTLGNEILSRYEAFSLGNAIRAKEPFVGTTRTKLENLVQDYQDRLLDQKVKP